jgi:hypothetical protein
MPTYLLRKFSQHRHQAWLPPSRPAGILTDATSTSGYQTADASYSWDHTCSGTDRYLVVGISMLSVAGSSVSSITYNGVSMSLLGTQASVSGAVRVELWGLTAPDTGTHSIAVILSTALDSIGNAISFVGVHQTTSTEGVASASATNVGAADATVNVTTVADHDWVVDVVATDDTAITVGAGQVQRQNISGTLGSGAMSTEADKTPAGSVTMSWGNVAGLATWSILAIGLRPVGAAAAGITGDATLTQDGQTLSAAGTLALQAAATLAQADNTLSAAAVLAIQGTATLTQADQTVSADGTLLLQANATLTEADESLTADGTLALQGNGTLPQADHTASAAGVLSLQASATLTQNDQTLAATSTLALQSDTDLTQADQTTAATGALDLAGAASLMQADQSSSAAGLLALQAASTLTQGDQTLNSIAALALQGDATATQADHTLNAQGGAPVNIGEANLTQDAQALSAAGTLPLQAAAALTQADATLGSAGVLPIIGAVVLSPVADVLDSTGLLPVQGTATATQDDQTVDAQGGAAERTADVAVTQDGQQLTSSGTSAYAGSASLTQDDNILDATIFIPQSVPRRRTVVFPRGHIMRTTGRLGQRHFNLDKQHALIGGHGVTCVVIPTLACPCVRAEGQFDPNDAHCRGTGRWPQPSLQYIVTLGLIAESSKRDYHEAGSWIEGSILCLVPPDVMLADRDLVRMLDTKDVFDDEVLQRGVHDAVRFIEGVSLLMVADFDGVYRPGIDYVLTPPNVVTWLPGGQSPGAGKRFSVRYEAYAEYLSFLDSPRLRVEGHVAQSQEVRLLRLDKLVRS